MADILETAQLIPELLTDNAQYWCYNGLDCCITFECWEALLPKSSEAEPTYTTSRAMQGPAWTLMQRGVKVDLDKKSEVIRELYLGKTKHERLLFRILYEAFDLESINYKSPDQLKAFFYGEVKPVEEGKKVTPSRWSILRCAEHSLLLEPIKVFDKQKKEYRSSTNREALEKLSTKPIAKHICEILLLLRDADKKIQVLETGLENGRMHCGYQVAGTLTGRWSSNESAFGSGTNLQNISDEMRRIFVPDEDFT